MRQAHTLAKLLLTDVREADSQLRESGAIDLASPQGLARVNQLLNQQATTLAYLQDFRLMMWITLAAIPLLLLLRQPTKSQPSRTTAPPPAQD